MIEWRDNSNNGELRDHRAASAWWVGGNIAATIWKWRKGYMLAGFGVEQVYPTLDAAKVAYLMAMETT